MANNLLPQLPGYDTLSKMYVAPMSGMLAEQNYDLSRQAAATDQESEQEKLNLARLQNPIKLKQDQATLEGTLQTNRKLTRENDWEEEFQPHKRADEVRKWALKAGEDDKKLYLQSVEKMMVDSDPKVQEMGRQLRAAVPDLWQSDRKDLRDHAQAKELEALRGKNQLNVANTYAAAKGAGGKGASTSFWVLLNKTKTANEKLTMIDTQLAQEKDPDELERLQAVRAALIPLAEREVSMPKPQPYTIGTGPDGKRTLTQTQPAPIPPNPAMATPPAAGVATRPVRQQAPTGSLADVQKMYPGVPADVLRQKYKQKFGVDLQ